MHGIAQITIMSTPNFNDALGVRDLNLAQHGRKIHKGRMID
ncbi:hypothetical protein Salmuc_02178 [Salipiger mucosus DSM 16094]|uniref:Uncharacterized protein n=1 Tax=Salipiger mucosus DSM 16094 TaxID=1123237 RepID=S9S035_9RHOB|nr:hypothetical protein Salmuc_02178 [Salipiger mucosus DSM 16094]